MEMENNLTENGKYIVYLTINTVNKYIYIGYHYTINPNGFDNYIGCGVITNHPSTYNKPKTPFQFAVKKYGPSAFLRTTLKVVDTLEEALKLEAELVDESFIKRRDTYNVALGGGEPARKEIEIYQYDLNGSFIKCWKSSVEAANYLNGTSGLIRNAIITKNTAYGYFWSNTLVQQLNMSEYKVYQKKDVVYKFDVFGKLVNSFKSIHLAAKDAKSSDRLILNAISGKTKSKGFYYSYDIDFTVNNNTYNKLTNVYLYNLDGSFYKEFATPRECADFFKDEKTSRIYAAIRTGGLYKGFQISKEKVTTMKNIKKCNDKKRVAQYNLNGKLIKIWDSIESAFKEYGPGVKKCLKGIQKKTKGFIFSFYE